MPDLLGRGLPLLCRFEGLAARPVFLPERLLECGRRGLVLPRALLGRHQLGLPPSEGRLARLQALRTLRELVLQGFQPRTLGLVGFKPRLDLLYQGLQLRLPLLELARPLRRLPVRLGQCHLVRLDLFLPAVQAPDLALCRLGALLQRLLFLRQAGLPVANHGFALPDVLQGLLLELLAPGLQVGLVLR